MNMRLFSLSTLFHSHFLEFSFMLQSLLELKAGDRDSRVIVGDKWVAERMKITETSTKYLEGKKSSR